MALGSRTLPAQHHITALPDPHPASAAVIAGGNEYRSSILPWRACGGRFPWVGTRHADKTAATRAALDTGLPQGRRVWGSDWNHALTGREYSGSIGGRRHLLDFLQHRKLEVPSDGTAHPPARRTRDH
jgi:hypothetical protein